MPHLQLAETTIYYEISGDGPPVLFLPGVGVSANIWQPVVDIVCRYHECILVDTRGAGLSGAPKGPYRMGDLAGDISAVISHLTQVPPVIAGLSMGGFVALTLALARESSISGLVLTATAETGASVDRRWLIPRRGLSSRKAVVDRIVHAGIGDIASSETADVLRTLILSRPLQGTGYLGQLAAIEHFDVGSSLSEISCPTCIIHGTSDRFIPFDVAERVAGHIPGSTLIPLKGVGHFPPVECPKNTAEAILELARCAFSA